MLEGTFLHGLKGGKGVYISFLCSSLFTASPLLMAETSLCSGLSFKYSSPPHKRLVNGVHKIYDEYLGPLMLQYEHSLPHKIGASLKVVYDVYSLMVGASLVWKTKAIDELGIKLTNQKHTQNNKLLEPDFHCKHIRNLRTSLQNDTMSFLLH